MRALQKCLPPPKFHPPPVSQKRLAPTFGEGVYQNFRVGGSPPPPPPPVKKNPGMTNNFTVNSYASECGQLRHVQWCTSRNCAIDNVQNKANIAVCTLREPIKK